MPGTVERSDGIDRRDRLGPTLRADDDAAIPGLSRGVRVPSSDGVTVAVHDLGGSGPPFLLCHATGFLGMAYAPMAAELRERFHVYAMDFRGHGDSLAPRNGRFDWDAMADDLLAVAAALTDGPIAAFGHSMGGATLLLAELRRPGLLESAYLFEPIVVPQDFPVVGPEGLSSAAAKRRARFASRAEAMWRYAGRPPLDVLQSGALAAYVEYGFRDTEDGEIELKCKPEHEAAIFDARGKPTFSMLGSVSTPTVVAIGTTERGWTPAMLGREAAASLPNGRLERLAHMGHFGPLQAPITIAASVLASH
jgi:pimeloyl-ACP methyl ester carboxylesterase